MDPGFLKQLEGEIRKLDHIIERYTRDRAELRKTLKRLQSTGSFGVIRIGRPLSDEARKKISVAQKRRHAEARRQKEQLGGAGPKK